MAEHDTKALGQKTVVNSWNEWDPLKHVIVGVADGCFIPPSEPASECKIPIGSDMKGHWVPRPQETVEKANIQLDNFADIMRKRGTRVDRPTPFEIFPTSCHPLF